MKKSERLASRLQQAMCSIADLAALEKEVNELRAERDLLRRNRGKFGHGCSVRTSFFATHVEMGEKQSLHVKFFWHKGKPALSIATSIGVSPLKFVVNDDSTLEVIE